MRTFGSGFTTKLASSSYLPVLFCKYELVTYVSGSLPGTGTKTTTNYYWSERAITYSSQAYQARIINSSPLEHTLESDNQSFGTMGLQISNSPNNIIGVIQAGMKCTVYLGFEDSVGSGTVTDAEIMYIGTVEGDIEITEDSVSFGLQDIAHTYDRQIPNLISRNEYPQADPDAVGDTKPIIMGRVKDHVCRPVAAGFASVLAQMATSLDDFIYVTDDIGWWIPIQKTTGLGKLTINTSTEVAGDYAEENATIAGIEFNSSLGLWKINLTAKLTHTHSQGDTIYARDYCSFVNEGYAYLVADHPVESITNVKIDGVSTGAYKYPNLQPGQLNCEYWKLPYNKAYVVVFTKPGGVSISGGATATVVDTIDVDDTIAVDDTIGIDEPGHEHETGSVKVYNYTLEINTVYGVVGSGYVNIDVGWQGGPTNGIRVLHADCYPASNVIIKNPITFTSTGAATVRWESVVPSFTGGSATIYSIIIKATRRSSTGSSSTVYSATGLPPAGLANGSVTPSFSAEVGGAITTNVKANVSKSGSAKKAGAAVKTGTVKLRAGNSAADVLVGQKVTCDVIGICDGTAGYVKPHNQIYKFINKYAANPISGTAGSGNVVAYQNESAANSYFDTRHNTSAVGNTVTSFYPDLNKIATQYENPSPSVNLSGFGVDLFEGGHSLDFAIVEPNRFRDVLGDMLFQSNSLIHWRNGIAQLKFIPDAPVENDSIDETDIIMQTQSLARTRSSDLATDISVRYDYSPGKDYTREYDYAFVYGSGYTYTKTPLDATQRFGTYTKERTYDLTMVRDRIGAEYVAKRIYDQYGAAKFESRISTVLKNLAIEPGDFVTAETPIYTDGVLDRGLVTQRTLEFGSAIDKRPDLIHLSMRENHTGDGFYLRAGPLSDSVGIGDAVMLIALNDVNTLFKTLADSVTLSETINVNKGIALDDSVGITESMAFNYELRLTDSVAITDLFIRFTGILFWDVSLTDISTLNDTTVTVGIRDSVYVSGVFVETSLTEVGVFE